MSWDIINDDCMVAMKKLPVNSVNLVFADPPFNIGYKYDRYIDRNEHYAQWTIEWMEAATALLKSHGSMFVAIGDEHAADVVIAGRHLGLTMRNWLIWHYTFGTHQKQKFGRCKTHILYFTVDPKKFTFNADEIRVPSARQTTYKDKRANPAGKVPDDVWRFPRICGTFKERTGHPCQMPLELLKRIVKVASNPGDLVLDPFSGSGTTVAAAHDLGRHAIGIELSKGYCKSSRQRLSQLNGQAAAASSSS